MKLRAKLAVATALSALLLAGTLASAASVALTATGGGQYALIASGLQNIGGMDATITYDTTTLANPQVTKGNLASSATLMGNAVTSGTYKVVMVSLPSITGNGTLAVLTFNLPSAAPGTVTGFSANFIDGNGATVPVSTSFSNLPDPSSGGSTAADQGNKTSGDTSSGQGKNTTVTTTGTTINSVNVTLPTEGALQPDRIKEMPFPPAAKPEPAPVALSVSRETESAAVGKGSAPPPPVNKGGNFSVQKSVLMRFKEFEGAKTPQALMALFSQPADAAVSQAPAVVLADGVALVKITVKTDAPVQGPPTFALKGASIVSQQQGEKGSWVIEARPKKGVLQASVTLLTNVAMTEYPLVVAPAVDIDLAKRGKVTEEDFILFLKDSAPPDPVPAPATLAVTVPTTMAPAVAPFAALPKGGVLAVPPATLAAPATVTPPAAPLPADAAKPVVRYDLNGDGRHDYIDDFIYTANYLARLAAEPKAPAKDLK